METHTRHTPCQHADLYDAFSGGEQQQGRNLPECLLSIYGCLSETRGGHVISSLMNRQNQASSVSSNYQMSLSLAQELTKRNIAAYCVLYMMCSLKKKARAFGRSNLVFNK